MERDSILTMSENREIVVSEQVECEYTQDILWTTVGKYQFFMQAGKKGLEAFMLYTHLQYTARLQKTNSVKAKDIYLKNGLCWGNDKLKSAKAFLRKSGLIEYKQRKRSNGTYGETYIVIKTATEPTDSLKISSPDYPDTRQSDRPVKEDKCFNKQSKCLNKKVNALKTTKIIQSTKGEKIPEDDPIALNRVSLETYFASMYKKYWQNRGKQEIYFFTAADRMQANNQQVYLRYSLDELKSRVDAWFNVPEKERRYYPLVFRSFINGLQRENIVSPVIAKCELPGSWG